ncbi:MAG: hypothetical protein KJP06_01390 [Deltaproteobacteria bacterium]|nr:hypothetical protein [Deltaproteobacteria bacterium]
MQVIGPHRSEKKDQVRISDQAHEQLNAEKTDSAGVKDEKDLGEEDKREVEKLRKRDQEVKAHERAHMAAGAGVVMGGANYKYEHGPDGKMYAVGGEVKIDTSKENDPEATIRKMQQVKKAALAPAQPSAKDRSVAAQAAQIEAEARIESQEQKAKEAEEESNHLENQPSGIATYPSYDSNNSSRIGRNLYVMA